MRTLDLGCGTYCRGDVGVDIDFTSRNKYDIPELFDGLMGGRREDCDRVMADANYPLPFRDGAFESVVMRDVIEHLRCPYFTLSEVKRILKANGVLKITTPNARKSEADWRDETHIYSFTMPTLSRLVSLLFRVRAVEYIFGEEALYLEAMAVEQADPTATRSEDHRLAEV